MPRRFRPRRLISHWCGAGESQACGRQQSQSFASSIGLSLMLPCHGVRTVLQTARYPSTPIGIAKPLRAPYGGADEWYALRGAQYPGFIQNFEKVAPADLATLAPPFLVQGSMPGVVQIWSGYLARTAPRWALLSRGAVNIPRTQGYESFEGIIETETWFGPLFTNVRLTRTNSPIEFHVRRPLFQVQPILRQCYEEPTFEVLEIADMKAVDWQRFEATMRPNTQQLRPLGHYAVDTRRRLRSDSSGR